MLLSCLGYKERPTNNKRTKRRRRYEKQCLAKASGGEGAYQTFEATKKRPTVSRPLAQKTKRGKLQEGEAGNRPIKKTKWREGKSQKQKKELRGSNQASRIQEGMKFPVRLLQGPCRRGSRYQRAVQERAIRKKELHQLQTLKKIQEKDGSIAI